ncbi:MAG: hypothetical protein VB084_06055 [Syntrophomonadaceae bacterium]|nr:hypothetical protein [Syntrophomonadaceae bacterium]
MKNSITAAMESISNIYKRFVYDQAVVVIYKCSNKEPSEVKTKKPIEIANVTSENVNDALVYEPEVKVNEFKRFLHEGDCGFYAYLNYQYIHRSWVTFGPKTETLWKGCVPLKIKKNEAFIRWGETVPSARGMGVSPYVLSHIVNLLSDRVEVFYISTTDDNVASKKGIEKVGFSLLSRCKAKKFLGLKFEKNSQKISGQYRSVDNT